ncbi:MAG: purine-nucleoside phosphorylase [Patescibacteria group bacterium]
MSIENRLAAARGILLSKFGEFIPKVSITLGSGLGYMTELLMDAQCCGYGDIPYCPATTATGHAGELWWGHLGGVPVVMLKGRSHLYEGHPISDVVFLTRLMIRCGVRELILTHAVGAVTRNLVLGDIVGIRSHIGFNCPDPTAGSDAMELGTEFTPMGNAYDPELLAIAARCALDWRISFHRGVSFFKPGRSYETAAEIEAMARAGADVATMSTVPDVMAAAQMGAQVLDLALVTNLGTGLGNPAVPLSHEEVQAVAESMKLPFGQYIRGIVVAMNNRPQQMSRMAQFIQGGRTQTSWRRLLIRQPIRPKGGNNNKEGYRANLPTIRVSQKPLFL